MGQSTKKIKEKTFRDFLKRHLADNLHDIANHGADAGYPWLTYTADTVELFDRYGDEIWKLACNMAEEIGYKNVAELIATFKRADMLDTLDTTKNLMVWFAAEEYARQLIEGNEEEDL